MCDHTYNDKCSPEEAKKKIRKIIDDFDVRTFQRMQEEFKSIEIDFDVFICYSKRGDDLYGLQFITREGDEMKKKAAKDIEEMLTKLSKD